MTFSAKGDIPIPDTGEAFEDVVEQMAPEAFDLHDVQKVGRSGQIQNGVDVVGRSNKDGSYVGIQCKRVVALTVASLRQEVGKSLAFKPPLKSFILVTTAPRDVDAQEEARLLTEAHKNRNPPLSVSVVSRHELQDLADRSPAIRALFRTSWSSDGEETVAFIREDNNRVIDAVLKTIGPASNSSSVALSNVSDEGTPLHGEITALQRRIFGKHTRETLDELEQMKVCRWSGASGSERFRLLSTMASAHVELDDLNSAAKCLFDAVEACPTHPKARQQRAAAYLLTDDAEKARAEALRALTANPEAVEPAVTVYLTNASLGYSDLFSDVPDAFHDVVVMRSAEVSVLRHRDDPTWIDAAIALYDRTSGSLVAGSRVQLHYAEAVATAVFERGLTHGALCKNDLALRMRLDSACNILTDHAESAITNMRGDLPRMVNNAVVPLRMLGRLDDAERLLSKVSVDDSENSILLQRVVLRFAQDDRQGVLDLIPNSCDDLQLRLIRAVCIRDLEGPGPALASVDDIESDTGTDHIDSFLLDLQFDCMIALGRRPDAIALLAVLRSKSAEMDSSFRYKTMEINWLEAFDEGSSDEILEALVPLALEQATPIDLVELALAARSQYRWDLVASLLEHVDRSVDSHPLQLLCVALLNGYAYRSLHELLENLPSQMKAMPFYSDAIHQMAEMFGTEKRFSDLRHEFLANSHSAELCLELLAAGALEGNESEAQALLLSQDLSALEGDPAERMRCCLIAAERGRVDDGVEAAYRLLLTNWSDVRLHDLWRTSLTMGPAVRARLEAGVELSAAGSVVTLTRDDGVKRQFRLEQIEGSALAAREIDPNSDLGSKMIGCRIGDNVSLVDEPGPPSWTVSGIDTGYTNAFGQSIERLDVEDAANSSMVKMQILAVPSDPLAELTDMFKSRMTHSDLFHEACVSAPIPLARIAGQFGIDELDIRQALAERDTTMAVRPNIPRIGHRAMMALQARDKKGCVLDTMVLTIVRQYRLEETIESVCGPIFVTIDTLRALATRAERARNDDDGTEKLTLVMQEGELRQHVVSSSDLHRFREHADGEFKWARSSFGLVSTLPKKDLDADERYMEAQSPTTGWSGPARACATHDLLLVSQDTKMRMWATTQGVESAWLEPILYAGAVRGQISWERVRQILLELAVAGERPGTIDPVSLIDQWRRDAYEPTIILERAVDVVAELTFGRHDGIVLLARMLRLARSEPASTEQQDRLCHAVFNRLARADAPQPLSLVRRVVRLACADSEQIADSYERWQCA